MDAIMTLASVPAILALVNFGKRLGVNGRVSLVLAVVLGVGINVANHYLGSSPGYQAAVEGLILGLAAAGLYDITPTSNSKEI